jgi:hypothetical protein
MTESIGAFCLKRDDQAIKERYAARLGPGLVEAYGTKPFYTQIEIDEVIRALALPFLYSCWGYSLFLPPAAFDALHRANGEACDYRAMRFEMAALIPTAAAAFDLAAWLPDLGSIMGFFDFGRLR